MATEAASSDVMVAQARCVRMEESTESSNDKLDRLSCVRTLEAALSWGEHAWIRLEQLHGRSFLLRTADALSQNSYTTFFSGIDDAGT